MRSNEPLIAAIMTALLIVPFFAWGQAADGAYNGAPGAAAVTCDTIVDSDVAAGNGAKISFTFGNQDWWGSPYTPTQNHTICSVSVYLLRTATAASYNITLHAFADSGGDIFTDLGTSDAIAASALSTGYTLINFPNMDVAVTSGTLYHLWLSSDGVDNINTTSIHITDGGTATGINLDDDGVAPTSVSNATKNLRYQTYE